MNELIIIDCFDKYTPLVLVRTDGGWSFNFDNNNIAKQM